MLATVITGSTLIAYLTGPVTVISLRKMAPDLRRPFALRYMSWLAPFSFILASMAIYWTMWPTTIQVILVIAMGLPIYLYYEIRYQHRPWKGQLRGAAWLIVYMVFMSLMSYLGDKGFGGLGIIQYPLDLIVIAIISYLFFLWGIASRERQVDPEVDKLNQQAH